MEEAEETTGIGTLAKVIIIIVLFAIIGAAIVFLLKRLGVI